ncbi:MAG: P1 family peptidase [Chloroflexi bacterium]|nr:P1 family peptidase [Chloroflexota bacterium]
MTGSITDVPGITVGHWTDLEGGTGCTVVLCEPDAVGGVDVRGAAPGTRETDVLRAGNLVDHVHAVVLSGGSAFGLDAACGVMRYLEEQGRGLETAGGRVPIVPAAVLFDLPLGRPDRRPTAEAGYAACAAAGMTVAEGTVGAGTGATVAKLAGHAGAVKGGLGTASQRLADGTLVAALVAVNALGSVFDPTTGASIAVPRLVAGEPSPAARSGLGQNTTIGVVATTAALDVAGAHRLAVAAHDGLARAIRPAHTHYDGDAIFALSLARNSSGPVDRVPLASAAADVMADAIVRAVRLASGLHGVPGLADAPSPPA